MMANFAASSRLIIYAGPDGDYALAARASSDLLRNPDFKNSGIVVKNGQTFYVYKNKSGSITVRWIK